MFFQDFLKETKLDKSQLIFKAGESITGTISFEASPRKQNRVKLYGME